MLGKRLSIEDLEALSIGTMVIVKRGYFNVDYLTHRCGGKLCLMPSKSSLDTLYYEDILKLEVYENVRETSLDYYGSIPYILSNNDWNKKIIDEFKKLSWIDTSLSPVYDQKSYKPESRILREFNIAKKMEYEVSRKTKEERLKYIIAYVEINIDKALESRNKDRFIMLTNKLKELRQACGVI